MIAYFDQLVDSRAGLRAIVRGAAVLTGCPARLLDARRRVLVRIEPDGRTGVPAAPPDPDWLRATVDGDAVLWLERPGPAGAVEAMVLERAAAAARAVLDRTRRAPAGPDEAAVEVVLDATAAPEDRRRAAGRLGLGASARAVAFADGRVRIVDGAATVAVERRAGVGVAVPPEDLPRSLASARTALRLTADGTDEDPGERVVHADALGGLAVLADAVGPASPPIPDVRAVEHAAAAAPWMLATLHAIAASPSVRTAATALRLHHSTLQDRVGHAEHLLGWSIRDPQGRLRLTLALALRQLHHNPVHPGSMERILAE